MSKKLQFLRENLNTRLADADAHLVGAAAKFADPLCLGDTIVDYAERALIISEFRRQIAGLKESAWRETFGVPAQPVTGEVVEGWVAQRVEEIERRLLDFGTPYSCLGTGPWTHNSTSALRNVENACKASAWATERTYLKSILRDLVRLAEAGAL